MVTEQKETIEMTYKNSALQLFARSDRGASIEGDLTKVRARTFGAPVNKLAQLIERMPDTPVRTAIEADIEAASAVLDAAGVWRGDGPQAQKAMMALWDVYGFETLVLALH
jgi:hypothetical protein